MTSSNMINIPVSQVTARSSAVYAENKKQLEECRSHIISHTIRQESLFHGTTISNMSSIDGKFRFEVKNLQNITSNHFTEVKSYGPRYSFHHECSPVKNFIVVDNSLPETITPEKSYDLLWLAMMTLLFLLIFEMLLNRWDIEPRDILYSIIRL